MRTPSEEQWQAVLDSAGEGIWGLDPHGNCTFVNHTAERIVGFAGEEMMGGNIHRLVHHHYADGRCFPEENCPITQALRRNVAFYNRIDTMFRKDGSAFEVEISAHPVSVEDEVLGVVVTFRDISGLRRQEEDLRRASELAEQQKAELDAVIEAIPHGVYIASKDGNVRSNRWAKAMCGERFPAELKTLDLALSGQPATETVQTACGWIRSVATPVIRNQKITGGVAVNTDVTQSRRQDEALRKSEKLAAVGQLASAIAHEINNPLESITNLLYLMRRSDSMEEVQEYARIAQEELSRVTEITLQTLQFHRQQSRPVEVDMGQLLRTVMALYTGRLLARNLDVEMKVVPTPPVLCLEGEIRQVVNNLVRNALDVMSEGGRLFVRVHPQTNLITGRKGVRLTVADTGEGVRPDIMQHLFEPFQTSKELTGTGLGLWVSKGIVEKHGGSIRIRTRRGAIHGTIFAVWLPLDGGLTLVAAAN